LRVLVAPAQQDDENVALPDVVDPIAGAEVQAKFLNAIPNRFRVPSISFGQTQKAIIDPQPRPPITQTVNPVTEAGSLNDLNLSFIRDILVRVNIDHEASPSGEFNRPEDAANTAQALPVWVH
jgi:hypothetical protein